MAKDSFQLREGRGLWRELKVKDSFLMRVGRDQYK
jgi:hypothetical protein